jgi:hypothetical protein
MPALRLLVQGPYSIAPTCCVAAYRVHAWPRRRRLLTCSHSRKYVCVTNSRLFLCAGHQFMPEVRQGSGGRIQVTPAPPRLLSLSRMLLCPPGKARSNNPHHGTQVSAWCFEKPCSVAPSSHSPCVLNGTRSKTGNISGALGPIDVGEYHHLIATEAQIQKLGLTHMSILNI